MEIVKEYPNLLQKSLCDDIIKLASQRLEPAQTVGEQVDGYRTAEYCWLSDVNDPALEWIQTFISNLTNLPIENQEDIHIVKYTKGGEYKVHHDFFHEDSPEELTRGGDRLFSFLIYLNDDFKGGETEFPLLKKKIKPDVGKGILWQNLDREFQPILESEHAGLPVTKGEKWILIIWVREEKFK